MQIGAPSTPLRSTPLRARRLPSSSGAAHRRARVRARAGVSLRGLPLYTALPTLSEWMIEQGWTCAYPRVANVGGWPTYAALTALYMLSVEFGVYWMHRCARPPARPSARARARSRAERRGPGPRVQVAARHQAGVQAAPPHPPRLQQGAHPLPLRRPRLQPLGRCARAPPPRWKACRRAAWVRRAG
eukprot:scaffold1216_cov357-Prasinococcus_capsulatus_cf.AAC.13